MPGIQSSGFFNRSNWREWLKAFVLIAATLLVYVPAIGGGFIWDDELFVGNPLFRMGPGSLLRFWFSPPTPDYFPVTSTSFWAEHFFFGTDPLMYHFDNVMLHIAVALLLWRVLLRLKIPGAWLGALIFALHPVNATSVAWVAERKNVLSGVFYLGAILAWLRFEEKGSWRWYMTALAAFLLALLSKTSVVVLPVALLICAWWRMGHISRRTALSTAPFFALALIFGLVTLAFQHVSAPGFEATSTESFGSRLAGAGWAIGFYLGKFFWPANQMMIYPRWEIDATSPVSWLPDAALAALLFVLWRYRAGRARPFFFALLYFSAALFPVLGFFFMGYRRYSLVADHFVYLPMMGIEALAGGLLATLAIAAGGTRWSWKGIATRYLLPGLAVAALSVVTLQRAWIDGDEIRVWSENIDKNPESWTPYGNLGSLLARAGKHKDAIPLFQTAIERDPDISLMHNNLAESYYKIGQVKTALIEYARALKIAPNYPEAHNNLGVALAASGYLPEALEHYRTAMDNDPYHLLGANNYGQTLIEAGRAPEAETFLREALRRYPEDPEMEANLGLAMAMQEKIPEAIACYRRALLFAPDDTRTRNNLGGALIQANRLPDAEEQFRAALKIAPQDADVRNNLALVLLKQNRPTEAIEQYRAVIKSNPEDPSAYNTLARVLATNRNSACRNGLEAIKLAETACKMTEYKSPLALDTAAAAYAESGRFDEAVKLEQSARDIALTTNQPSLVAEMEQRLKVYQAGQPLRE